MRFGLVRWGVLLSVFLVPIGTKKFLFDFPTPFRNYYTSEYTSAFIYGSDIVIFLLLFLLLFSKPVSFWEEQLGRFRAPLFFLGLFLILSAVSLAFAGSFYFGVYSFARLVLGVLFAIILGASLRGGIARFKEVAIVLSFAAVFEAIVGFFQFVLQKSTGFWFLGETVFSSGMPGIATVTVNGVDFARAYGTMPHANILAGFLVLGLLTLFYLFIREENPRLRVAQASGIFIVLTGLLLTFSRSGWIIGGISLTTFFVWEFLSDRERRRKVIYLVALFLVACFSLIACLGWVVSPRAYLSSGEGPVADRWSYDKIGAEIILSEPFGVGVGNQLFYTYKSGLFEKYDVNSWGQWQPIHNLYLLVGSETGILGLLAFVVFVYLLIRSGFKEGGGFGGLSPETRTSLVILLALLLFGLFDHFLWDLQLGRLMFWVALGILLGVSTGEKLKSEGG